MGWALERQREKRKEKREKREERREKREKSKPKTTQQQPQPRLEKAGALKVLGGIAS
jgi:hypothetical protein